VERAQLCGNCRSRACVDCGECRGHVLEEPQIGTPDARVGAYHTAIDADPKMPSRHATSVPLVQSISHNSGEATLLLAFRRRQPVRPSLENGNP
jgi:hypothetical protein